MLTKQTQKLADVLVEKKIAQKEDRDNLAYGLSSGLAMLVNALTTLALGLLFGLWLESLIFLMFFALIRTYAGGFHCQTEIGCYFVSSGIVVLALSLVKFTPEQYIFGIGLIILLISLPILLKLAPIETPNKPLDEVEKRYFRKKTVLHLILECTLILILFLMNLYVVAYTICLGILMSALLVFFGNRKIN